MEDSAPAAPVEDSDAVLALVLLTMSSCTGGNSSPSFSFFMIGSSIGAGWASVIEGLS